MGIPKFFRYISERYPLILQRIEGSDIIPEFDNFYVDCNHLIHNCVQDGKKVHFSEDEVFVSVYKYLDHIFSKVKPKELFFIAVDGVPPCAKMDQQRSNRLRRAMEYEMGRLSEEAFEKSSVTSGTVFMSRISDHLHYFINRKITEDPAWQGIRVILSGHEVPGEGEHKIMEYIRHSRAQPGYNPNTRHCLYGMDADLILLGLVTHEPHFCLLRDEFDKIVNPRCLDFANFDLLHLSLMREYLDFEFKEFAHQYYLESPGLEYDLECIIDDFILITVFLGNDFLPPLPDLDITKHGLEVLFDAYKQVLPKLYGYINGNGVVNMTRLRIFIQELALWEKRPFATNSYFSATYHDEVEALGSWQGEPLASDWEDIDIDMNIYGSPPSRFEHLGKHSDKMIHERKKDYYESELNISYKDNKAMNDLVYNYLEGLQWVMHYYYTGVVSWRWHYRYSRAPRVSDLTRPQAYETRFNFVLGKPFKPFEHLRAILPFTRRHLIPEAYHTLISTPDYPIQNTWPGTVDLKDLDRNDYEWETAVNLPFLREQRLLDAIVSLESKLTDEEYKRNSFGEAIQFSYDAESRTTSYPSPPSSHYLNIRHCKCRKELFELPSLDGLHPVFGLCDGVLLGRSAPFGFPTFKTLPHTAKVLDNYRDYEHKRISNDSRSIGVSIEHPYANIAASELAEMMIGKSVLFRWPILKEGLVVGISTGDFAWKETENGKYYKGYQNDVLWYNRAEQIEQAWWRGGLLIGKVKVLVHIRPLKGIKWSKTGRMLKEYGLEKVQPLQLCADGEVPEVPRFPKSGSKTKSTPSHTFLPEKLTPESPIPSVTIGTCRTIDNVPSLVPISTTLEPTSAIHWPQIGFIQSRENASLSDEGTVTSLRTEIQGHANGVSDGCVTPVKYSIKAWNSFLFGPVAKN